MNKLLGIPRDVQASEAICVSLITQAFFKQLGCLGATGGSWVQPTTSEVSQLGEGFLSREGLQPCQPCGSHIVACMAGSFLVIPAAILLSLAVPYLLVLAL